MILQVKEITVVFFKQPLDHFPNSNTKIKKLTEEKIKPSEEGRKFFLGLIKRFLTQKLTLIT